MKLLRENLIPILIALATCLITWGKLQADFSSVTDRVGTIEIDRSKRIEKNEKDMDYLKSGVATLLERTKHL